MLTPTITVKSATAISRTPMTPPHISCSRERTAVRVTCDGLSSSRTGSRRMRDERSSTVFLRGVQCLLTRANLSPRAYLLVSGSSGPALSSLPPHRDPLRGGGLQQLRVELPFLACGDRRSDAHRLQDLRARKLEFLRQQRGIRLALRQLHRSEDLAPQQLARGFVGQ